MPKILASVAGAMLASALVCGTFAPALAAGETTTATVDEAEAAKPVLVSYEIPATVVPGSRFTVTATVKGGSEVGIRDITLQDLDGSIPGTYKQGNGLPTTTKDYATNTYTGTWEFYVADIPYGTYSGYQIIGYDEDMNTASFILPDIVVDDPAHPIATAPVVTGTPRMDEMLTAKISAGKGAVVTYKWYSRYGIISGSTVKLNDYGYFDNSLHVTATATFPDGVVRIRSTSIERIGLGVPNPPAPKTNAPSYGTAVKAEYVHGQDLFVTSGKATTSIQWLLNGKVVPGATTDTYQPKLADIGKKLQVRTTTQANSIVYVTEPTIKLSAPAIITEGTLKAPVPKIVSPAQKGTPTYVLSTLKASTGTWTPKTSLSYQWQRNGKNIKGATKSSYKMLSADAGTKVTVRVTGKQNGFTTKTVTSSAIKPVLRKLSKPKLYTMGTRKVGYTQKALYDPDLGKWTKGTKVSFQWYRSGKPIKGVTGKSYKLTKTDKGKTLEVRAVGKKDGYATVTLKASFKVK